MAKPRAPRNLGQAGSRLWKDVTGPYDLRPDELNVLESACREADLSATLQQVIDAPDFEIYTTGSMGQRVIDPVISEVRQHRATMQRLLAALKLPDSPGASAGRSTEDISAAARRAANVRWGNG